MKIVGNPDIIFSRTELLQKVNGYLNMSGLTVKAVNVKISKFQEAAAAIW